jgi:hypothetical protein
VNAMGKAFNMPFVTALLLTGSSARAEAAVVAAIDGLDLDHASDETLLRAVATAAVRQRSDAAHVVSSWILPFELRNVFHLPRDPSQQLCLALASPACLARCARIC